MFFEEKKKEINKRIVELNKEIRILEKQKQKLLGTSTRIDNKIASIKDDIQGYQDMLGFTNSKIK